jgi:hypothetical protein
MTHADRRCDILSNSLFTFFAYFVASRVSSVHALRAPQLRILQAHKASIAGGVVGGRP